MPRPRGSEMAQRQQSARGPHPLRTLSSSSVDRSPKVGSERRSPRVAPHSDPPLQQKKLGTRIADLESQLGQAQEELKSLKDQLATAEAAKKEAQKELESKSSKKTAPNPDPEPEEGTTQQQPDQETDVYEVPVDKKAVLEVEVEPPLEKLDAVVVLLKTTPSPDEEINVLRAKLEDKDKELEVSNKRNQELKGQLNEAAANMSSAKAKEEEMVTKLRELEQELGASKGNEAELRFQLESIKEEKQELQGEVKRMTVQTEQWRKAADAAAAMLAGGNGRMIISERCASMDKHVFQTPARAEAGAGAGFVDGFVGSPGFADDVDGGFGSGKQRRGSGIKMFGDLWRRKPQK